MTRIVICTAETLPTLEEKVNAEMARVEAEGFGVKSLLDLSNAFGRALMVVYGNGPTTTQRWSGSHG